jgi:hypothetical protein
MHPIAQIRECLSCPEGDRPMIIYAAVSLVILAATFIDAYADGSRRRWMRRRGWHIALSCVGDLLVLVPIFWYSLPLGVWALTATAFARIVQERWWNDGGPRHIGTRWDWWHRVKACRYYPPILVLMVLTVMHAPTWWALPWAAGMIFAGKQVWRAGKVLSNAPWE